MAQRESDQIKRLLGDPPYRADAYRDVSDRFTANRSALRERLADQSVEARVLRLWDEEVPIGAIAVTVGVTLGEVYVIVSRSDAA